MSVPSILDKALFCKYEFVDNQLVLFVSTEAGLVALEDAINDVCEDLDISIVLLVVYASVITSMEVTVLGSLKHLATATNLKAIKLVHFSKTDYKFGDVDISKLKLCTDVDKLKELFVKVCDEL